jgi:hypothetical protein
LATKKIQPAQAKPTWGKTLTKAELLALLDRLDQKRKDREMNKMAETLARALEKKNPETMGQDLYASTCQTFCAQLLAFSAKLKMENSHS